MFDLMEDCMHLKACRRVQKIGRSLRLRVPRYCDEDCSAYETIDDFIEERDLYTRDDVTTVMHGACRDGQKGYTDLLIEDYVRG